MKEIFLRAQDLKKHLTTQSHLCSLIVHKVLITSTEKKTIEGLMEAIQLWPAVRN